MNWIFRILHADHRLGLRVIKTGLAVTVCVVISVLVRVNEPLLAVIATVMSMGKSIDMSVKSGKDKMVGALIGAAFGGLFALISPANAGLCGVGVILVLYLCHSFRLNGAGALASITFAAVMFGASGGTNLWQYVLACTEDALIGIAVAVIINLIVMPPNYAEEIKRAFSLLRERTLTALDDAQARREIDIRSLEDTIGQLNRNLQLYISEAKLLRWNDDEVFGISCRLTVYRMIFDELKAVESLDLSELISPGTEILTVYGYHIRRMRELYESTLKDTPDTAAK
jgi:uncharacterized membrane protein YgaE (UPF0421/DUF939 family)